MGAAKNIYKGLTLSKINWEYLPGMPEMHSPGSSLQCPKWAWDFKNRTFKLVIPVGVKDLDCGTSRVPLNFWEF